MDELFNGVEEETVGKELFGLECERKGKMRAAGIYPLIWGTPREQYAY